MEGKVVSYICFPPKKRRSLTKAPPYDDFDTALSLWGPAECSKLRELAQHELLGLLDGQV